jgi:uncharacterized Fe-S cluster protein YjdI
MEASFVSIISTYQLILDTSLKNCSFSKAKRSLSKLLSHPPWKSSKLQHMDTKTLTKKYTNGEVTVVWQPSLCRHSTICFKGLPEVFNPRKRPWIEMKGSSTIRIVEQVNRCPSGALSFYFNDEGPQSQLETNRE